MGTSTGCSGLPSTVRATILLVAYLKRAPDADLHVVLPFTGTHAHLHIAYLLQERTLIFT